MIRALIVLAALPVAFACGGDATNPTTSSIASIVVTGTPSATMLVGDSVHLIATAVNATGGIVSNQNVSWSSSAPNVVAVSSGGLMVALSAGTATITASSNGHDGIAIVTVADGLTLGTQGGVMTAAAGQVTLSVPAGGVAQSTLLLVHPATNAPADSRVVPSTAFELGPDGVVFQRAATMTIIFDASKIPSGIANESLQLYAQSGNAWAVVAGSKVDITKKTVTGAISRSGIYAVRSTAVDRIAFTGNVAGGALFAGQTSLLSATLYAITGDSLPPRAMTWSSSDPTRVKVDVAGNVTAVAAGSATISATTDGKSATTVVTILGRVAADWSRATDWSTNQGNAQHSGYVDATLDVLAFKQLWAVTPSAGNGYYQPTVGGGHLFLGSNVNSSRLFVLSAADGSTQWDHNFGTSFGINQATYDNGSVYVASGGHEDTYMWALDATTGAIRFQTAFESQWEHWNAPIVVASTIVAAGGYYGGMYGFSATTGKQVFFASGPQVDSWAPSSVNGIVYAAGYVSGGGVRAFTPTDGKVAYDIADSRLTSVTTPAIGTINDLLTISAGNLTSVDLGTKKVAWQQSGGFTGAPVVGGGVVYALSGTIITARRESDGSQLWSWSPAAPNRLLQTMLLTNNLLFVRTINSTLGLQTTIAIDLSSHLTVWSYPTGGDMALSSQGVLFIVSGSNVVAVNVR